MQIKELRALRKAAGLSLKEASAKLGMTYTTLSRIELGTISLNIDTMKALAELYGCQLSIIMGENCIQLANSTENSITIASNNEEKELLKDFRELSESDKAHLSWLISTMKKASANCK